MKIKKYVLVICLLSILINLNAQLKMFTNGNVTIRPIPASAPTVKLQVVGNSVFNSTTSTIYSSALIRGLNNFSTSVNPDYTWTLNDQTGLFHPSLDNIGFSSAGRERMRITYDALQINSSGDWNQCIKVNATTQYACAYGIRYNNSDRFYVTAEGRAYGYAFIVLSDISLKENITPITSALEKVKRLNGVYYNLKKEVLIDPKDTITILPYKVPKTEIGFIAQEVEKIVPELVTTMQDGKKAVAYQNMVALLVEAFKEQDAKIEQMQLIIDGFYHNNTNNTSSSENNIGNHYCPIKI